MWSLIRQAAHHSLRLCSEKPAFIYERSEDFLKRFTMSEWTEYELWLFRNRLFTLQRLKELYSESIAFKRKPKISIIMPVYNPDPLEFQQAINSILWQAYPYWELCIADDSSQNREYLKILKKFRDRRIKIRLQDTKSGIAGTSQRALKMASGEYIALMDQDDELYPDALYCFAAAIQTHDIDYFYSDKDMISPAGKRYMHSFRPDWSPECLLSFNYVSHIEIYKKVIAEQVGGFRSEYEGSQDYDLVLRATEKTNKIYHMPMILYSWRKSIKSIAHEHEAKSYVYEAGINALKDACKRRYLPVKDVIENPALWRGNYKLIWDEEKLSAIPVYIVLIQRDPKRGCGLAKSLVDKYSGIFKIALISSFKNIDGTIKSIPDDGYVFFCDDSLVEIIEDGFVDMIGHLGIEGVGAVGSKFTDEDNKIFCCGISITGSGKWLLNYRGSPLSEHGYGAVASAPRNVSLAFPAFWGSKASLIKESGCFNGGEHYCEAVLRFFMQLRKAGRRIAAVPYMNIRLNTGYAESFTDCMNAFMRQWESSGMDDIYYNPNLTDSHEDFGIKI